MLEILKGNMFVHSQNIFAKNVIQAEGKGTVSKDSVKWIYGRK